MRSQSASIVRASSVMVRNFLTFAASATFSACGTIALAGDGNGENSGISGPPTDTNPPVLSEVWAMPAIAGHSPSEELLELRGANAKHFANPDGSVTAVLSRSPIHYRDDSGQWREIGTAIANNDTGRLMNYEYAVTQNRHKVFMSHSAGGGYAVEVRGGLITVGGEMQLLIVSADGKPLLGVPKGQSTAHIEGNRAYYPDIFSPLLADERLSLRRNGIKHDVRIRERPLMFEGFPADSYLVLRDHITLPAGWAIVPAEEEATDSTHRKLHILDETRTRVGSVPPPIVRELEPQRELHHDEDKGTYWETRIDATLGSYRIEHVEGTVILDTLVPLSWLTAPSRVYPVLIDPSINLDVDDQSSWNWPAGEIYSSTSCNQSVYTQLECRGGETSSFFMYFDLSALTPCIDVTNVVWWFWCEAVNAPYYEVRKARTTPSCSGLWNDAHSGTLYYTCLSSSCYPTANAWASRTLSNTSHADLEAAAAGSLPFGIVVHSLDSSTSFYFKIDSYDGITAGDEPYLAVTYTTLSYPATPSNISASDGTYCDKVRVTWSAATGATSYKVYRSTSNSACPGSPIASSVTGTSYDDTSASSGTTYYYSVKASNACGDSSCSSTNSGYRATSSSTPSGASASPSSICPGSSSSTLTVQGGSLGSGASWQWYRNSCGGTWVGSGSSISVSPSSTTTYYVRAEGTCYTTDCASVTVTVNSQSTAPSGATASPSSVCSGGSSTLSVQGGSLGSGATWRWYSGSCGGVSVGSGASINVRPGSTTTYYVRAEGGTCPFTTNCANVTVTVNSQSSDPSAVSANPSLLCAGGSSVLTVQGGSLGSGANWQWYSGWCGGTWEGSGPSITVWPGSTTTYYVRAEGGTCNVTTNCASATVSVQDSIAWYPDSDGDGYGAAGATPEYGCAQPPGKVANADDCDDNCSLCRPGGTEVLLRHPISEH